MSKNKPLAGLLGSMLIFGTIGIFRRFIPLSSTLLACARGFMGAAFLLVILALRPRRSGTPSARLSGGVILLLLLSGAFIGVNWILLFEAYNYTTVATATLCYYMQPTIVILLSPLILREKLTLKKGLCALAAVIGMIFVSGVADGGLPTAAELRGILCGLGAAVFYAAVVMMNKKLPGIDAYKKTILQLLSAAVVLLPYLLLTEDFSAVSLDLRAWILLLLVGFVHTGLAYALYFGSLDGLSAQTAAIGSYLDPVTALLLSALLLDEKMTLLSACGAVLILGAALLSELELPQRSRKE